MAVAIVTVHALARARERDPEFAVCRSLRQKIASEVVAAVADGRMAKRCPAWARRQWLEGQSRTVGEGVRRFVWDEGLRRCYVVKRAHRSDDRVRRVADGSIGWIVITVLVAGMGDLDGVTVQRKLPTRCR